jgi:hypothetical protein
LRSAINQTTQGSFFRLNNTSGSILT